MKITGMPLAGIAEAWLTIEPQELVAVLRGGQVSTDLVERMEEGLPRLRFLEATRGGDRARTLIHAELGMVVDVLDRSAYTTAVGRRLYALAVELGRMAGWASFDAGLHAAAQRYWLAALHAADAADDRLLGANILKSMSLQCYDFDHPREALELARSAHEGAQGATPRAAAMLARCSRWQWSCRSIPSPAASVASSTRTGFFADGSVVKCSRISSRSSVGVCPWMTSSTSP